LWQWELAGRDLQDFICQRQVSVCNRTGDSCGTLIRETVDSTRKDHRQAAILVRICFRMLVDEREATMIESVPSFSGTDFIFRCML
jgi:hypothetical protein